VSCLVEVEVGLLLRLLLLSFRTGSEITVIFARFILDAIHRMGMMMGKREKEQERLMRQSRYWYYLDRLTRQGTTSGPHLRLASGLIRFDWGGLPPSPQSEILREPVSASSPHTTSNKGSEETTTTTTTTTRLQMLSNGLHDDIVGLGEF
jgi:hypothetical protein